MLDFVALKGAVDFVCGLANLWKDEAARNEAIVSSRRLLLVEVHRNLAILDSLQLDSPESPPSTNDQYLLAAKSLSTEAHTTILLTCGIEEDELWLANASAERRSRMEQHWTNIPVTFDLPGGAISWKLAETDQALTVDLKRMEERIKLTGILEALAFVAARVEALKSLATLRNECGDILKNIRPKIRLRTIAAYERGIAMQLESQNTLPRVRPQSGNLATIP